MKSSLSFISSKLGASKTANDLSPNEITQLQDRLASTEAQMYKILSALDAASSKMNEITKTTRESLEQPHQVNSIDEILIHPTLFLLPILGF
jgi:phage-related tail protein